ncbi:MAG: prepilin-type N-terminal cleavage/methylation domain-containing protein [Candidatus Pacebacteria bacterium]|nr:prepilin-type N-terminal cleavage/methylation domain-containing protein [Candidatus Paceibacterota bacterium]
MLKNKINNSKTDVARGFTLLELLIVISIIGVLASITIIAYPSYAKKARLANALHFSDNIRGSLQQDMIAWWKFDETSGTVAKDSWWNQLNGTVYGGATFVLGIKGNALSFDGVDDYVSATNNTSITSAQTTVSAWIKFSGLSNYSRIIDMRDGTNGLQILYDKNSGRFVTKHSQFQSGNTATQWNTPTTEVWYHIVAVFDSVANTTKFYVNGIAQTGAANNNVGNGNVANKTYIGVRSDLPVTNTYFNGLIDDVQIYSATLPQAAIQQLYAEGLKDHQDLAIK